MQSYFDDICSSAPSWLMDDSPSADVVIFAEAYVFRNLAGYPFCLTMREDERERILSMFMDAISGAFDRTISISELAPLQRLVLSERWAIPIHLAESPVRSVVLMNNDESQVVALCGFEHFSIRIATGFENLPMAATLASQFVDSMRTDFGWAIHPEFGYLSPNPALCGAGTIFSAVCHIPAIIITNKLPEVRNIAETNGIGIKDPWLGGFDMGSSFVKFVTQSLVGNTQDDLLAKMSMTVETVVAMERAMRENMKSGNDIVLSDKVKRAYGIISYADLIELWEFNSLISTLRLGAAMGILSIPLRAIDELLVIGQQAHISSATDDDFTPMRAAVRRAKIAREKLLGGDLPM